MKTRGQWRKGSEVGGCSTCEALKVNLSVEVFELRIGSTEVRQCAPCLENLSGVIALGKREQVLGTENT